MQDFEASDDVATTNIDTIMTATRIGSLRFTINGLKYYLGKIGHVEELRPVLAENMDATLW